MTLRKALVASGMAAGISLGMPDVALAHGPGMTSDDPGYGWHYGWHMGPMMGGRMGPGMMGPGYGMGYGMGPRMMGRRMGPGYGMGYGMMGPGMRGFASLDLSEDDVKAYFTRMLAIRGNKRLKLGKVAKKDDDTIEAEIVTVDGSLVNRYAVDRRTGFIQSVE